MKLSAIKTSENNNKHYQQNGRKAQSFTGFADGVVNFWQFVDNGGRALQFTVEDMAGTNIWRTGKGLFAGYKYTHQLNPLAALQEGLREFLTGPLMCIIPVVVLNLAKKGWGETSNTHTENIKNLTYIMSQTQAQEGQTLTDEFYNNVIKDLLKQSAGESSVTKENIDLLKQGMQSYAEAPNKKEAKKIIQELQNTFETIVKEHKESYKGINFLNAKYTVSDVQGDIGSTNFKNYVGYINAYIQDFTKHFKDKEFNLQNLDSFKNNWLVKRLAVAIGMFGITCAIVSQIPKIYTKASGKINPNAKVIYNEAGKTEEEKGGNK